MDFIKGYLPCVCLPRLVMAYRYAETLAWLANKMETGLFRIYQIVFETNKLYLGAGQEAGFFYNGGYNGFPANSHNMNAAYPFHVF